MSKVYIIAEAGVNHNGSIEIAERLIDVAKNAGADAVKFQTFKATNLSSQRAPKASYQVKMTGHNESQLEMLQKLELSLEAHLHLESYCRNREIQFLSTPFDVDSLILLTTNFDLPYLKIPSGEITNAPFLLQVAATRKSVILSTGMSTLADVEAALSVFAFGYLENGRPRCADEFSKAFCVPEALSELREKITLLHCTTEYPTPYEDVNLRAMDTLYEKFGLRVGLSDHTEGFAVAVAAVARGASVIEKHFTLDKSLPGPDHQASLSPDELKALVVSVRQVESALGSYEKKPASSEIKNIEIVRKSLVAAKDIKKGEFFTELNLTCKRPGTGISPMKYWDMIGSKAERDYCKDEVVL